MGGSLARVSLSEGIMVYYLMISNLICIVTFDIYSFQFIMLYPFWIIRKHLKKRNACGLGPRKNIPIGHMRAAMR